MKILVDINHPAHVHLFKHAIEIWKNRGDDVLVTAREKDVTYALLENLNIEFVQMGSTKPGLWNYPLAVLASDTKLFWQAKQFDPDFLIGTSFSIAHVSKLLRGKSIVFGEDDFSSSKLFWSITRPFADYIVTPDTIKDNFGKHHIKYSGCHELAYLHPNHIKSHTRKNKKKKNEINEPYSIVRFVSLLASHDMKERGINDIQAKKLIGHLSKFGKVVVSSERKLDDELEVLRLSISPEKIHDILASAEILISDSQTMSVEAAILGTPSVRINSFAGRIPVLEEMEKEYQLTYGFQPNHLNEAIQKAEMILSDSDRKKIWRDRAEKYIRDKIDLTKWMVDFLDKLEMEM